MDAASTILFVQVALIIASVVMSYKTEAKVFNLFAVGLTISVLITSFAENTTMIILGVLFIVWLIFDLLKGGFEG